MKGSPGGPGGRCVLLPPRSRNKRKKGRTKRNMRKCIIMSSEVVCKNSWSFSRNQRTPLKGNGRDYQICADRSSSKGLISGSIMECELAWESNINTKMAGHHFGFTLIDR